MLTQNEIEILILPYKEIIEKIHYTALEHFINCYSEDKHKLRKTSIANVLRDFIVYEAKVKFGELKDESVQIIEKANGTFFIEVSGHRKGIEGSVIARFKKVNKQLLTANIPTKASINFNTQRSVGYLSQPYLDGEDWQKPPKTLHPSNINIGYLPNELGTDLNGIFLTYPNGQRSIAWFVSMLESKADLENISFENVTKSSQIVVFPVETTFEEKKPRRVFAKKKQDNIIENEKVEKNANKS
jgi:hypothetical protein